MNRQQYRQIAEYSLNNLLKLGNRLARYKQVRPDFEVKAALDGLNLWHCVRQENIVQVLKDGKILIKKDIKNARMTNSATDYAQGFDQHVSLSIGKPWLDYGPYCFAFGLDKIAKDALFFTDDPYRWSNEMLRKNVFTKLDFILAQSRLLERNMLQLSERWFVKLPFKINLDTLINLNCRRFEIKQTGNLDIDDADEFVLWTKLDEVLYKFVRVFWNKYIGIVYFVLLILAMYAGMRVMPV